ncbi:hypothetical protein ACSVBT_02575 [Afipia sp. TerB]
MINRPPQHPLEGGHRLPAVGLPSSASPAHNEAVRIVCLALGLACVALVLRIASMW